MELKRPNDIKRAVARLEIPDCTCELRFVDCGCEGEEAKWRVIAKDLRRSILESTWADDRETAETLRTKLREARVVIRYYQNCECPRLLEWPPCQHILDHDRPKDWTFTQWADFLQAIPPSVFRGDQDWENGQAFRDPPVPNEKMVGLQREERVAVYAARHHAGCRLFHPHDVVTTEKVPIDDLGLRGGPRAPNGHDLPLGLITGRRAWKKKDVA